MYPDLSIILEAISMNKVAQVTLYFWIMKICATTLGETAGDRLVWVGQSRAG
jgi:uncharacterized membrane-anchored protein